MGKKKKSENISLYFFPKNNYAEMKENVGDYF